MVVCNLRKARQKWVRLTRVLGREGLDARNLLMFYVTVIQEVFSYGLETWMIYPFIVRTLSVFRHRLARRLTGQKLWRVLDGRWVYPPLAEVMA